MALLNIPEVSFSSGSQKMPFLGLSCEIYPYVVQSETVEASILQAIELGYRHFETATIYQTEEPTGEAIAAALRLGLIKSRDELFITSKLWCSDAHDTLVLPALKKTLQNLKLEYIDLYLIHWPMSSTPGIPGYPIRKGDLLPMDFKAVWAAMEDCQRLGLTKSIGVSNFSCKKLSNILASAKIPPAVNLVEMNPTWQQRKLVEFSKANGVLVVACCPPGCTGAFQGSNRVMECEILNEIAGARETSIAQVCLRWAYEQGIAVTVKSFRKDWMVQNLEIFNWALSKEESGRIHEIPQRRECLGEEFVSENGPLKSVEDLWDGEL